jgi:uncharacterized protein YjeT (DUF2065 family)
VSDLLVALGLVLVIEGVLYAAFPQGMKQAIAQALNMPDGTLRAVGVSAAGVGVLLVWLVRG